MTDTRDTELREEILAVYHEDLFTPDEIDRLVDLVYRRERAAVREVSEALFLALKDVWLSPPQEMIEIGTNKYHWDQQAILESLDVLQEEWMKRLGTEPPVDGEGKGEDVAGGTLGTASPAKESP